MKIRNFLDRDDDAEGSDEESTETTSSSKLPSTYDCYELELKIDEGGVKEIRKMRDHKTGRSIAMATLRPEFHKPEHINRFLREARTLASLEHPNIVPLYDIGYYNNDLPFFSMKLLNGVTLAKALENEAEKPPNERDQTALLNIFYKVCDAISYAHSRSITHLDLKPANIQISEYGEVLVLDWGFAKNINEAEEDQTDSLNEIDSLHSPTMTNITRVGAVNGTPGYMSPEQAKGDRDELDQGSDIYALGAILYNIITLKRPYKGDTVEMILHKTVDGELPPIPKNSEENIPNALIAITEKAMNPVKSDRYQSVKELQSDISAYMHGYATRAENADLFRILALLIKRNKKPLLILSIFVTILSTIIFQSIRTIEETENRGQLEKELAVKKEKLESIGNVIRGYKVKIKDLRVVCNFKDALNLTLELQAKGYDHPEIWFQEALLQYGEMNFERANFCIEKLKNYPGGISDEHRKDIGLMEARLFPNKDNVEEMITIARDCGVSPLSLHLLWTINSDPNKTLEEKITILRKGLHIYNPSAEIDNINIKYTTKGDKIQLDLSKNKSIQVVKPIIGLPIDEINISDTSVYSLNYVVGFFTDRVNKINVSNTELNFKRAYLRGNYQSITAKNITFTAHLLERCKNLEYLDLEGSSIYLRNMSKTPPTLKYLNIAGTETIDMTGLLKLKKLETLVIDNEFDKSSPTLAELKNRGVNIIVKHQKRNTVPGVIEAENYSDMEGIAILKKDDGSFDKYVSFIDKGDRLSYDIDLINSLTLDAAFTVSTSQQGADFDISINKEKLLSINIPTSKNPEDWVTQNRMIQLPKGKSKLELTAISSGWKLDKMRFKILDTFTSEIPGKVESENFFKTNHSEGGRTKAIKDGSGGTFVGWIETDTYYNYSVDVRKAGKYKLTLKFASVHPPVLDIKSNDHILTTIQAQTTEGYFNWDKISTEVYLNKGPQTLSIWPKSKGWNMDWVEFEFIEE